jgi:hypothetical protein
MPASPSLPQFPAFTLASVDICWLDCALDNSQPLTALWSVPVPAQTGWSGPICSVFFSNLRLYDSRSNLVWKGQMRLWYSRTWLEIDNTGVGPSGLALPAQWRPRGWPPAWRKWPGYECGQNDPNNKSTRSLAVLSNQGLIRIRHAHGTA